MNPPAAAALHPSPSVGGLREPFSVASLAALAQERAAAGLWLDDGGLRTWADFTRAWAEASQACARVGLEPGALVVTPGESRLDSLAWFFAAAAAGAVVAPLRRERAGELEGWKTAVAPDWQVREGRLVRLGAGISSAAAGRLLAELRSRGHPGLILGTGGTTGLPKLVLHDLAALLATLPARPGRPLRVLPLMRFDHIGGLDMAWRALAGGQILVAPPSELTVESVAATIARHRVEVMAATPSFLNLLLMADAGRFHDLGSLRLVPYGAEPMPAGLLRRLQAALPAVDFVQRFGTSETGALPVRSVGSGLVLDERQPEFEWKIEQGELWIRTPGRALGYLAGDTGGLDASGWFRTGDLAERRPDGTVAVLGRRSELINVGGEKVLPSDVESVLLEHPFVADCRVGPATSAVLGQVVAADVVWRGVERDAVAVKRLLHQFGADRLARHQLPAVVRLVEVVEATRNLKKARINSP